MQITIVGAGAIGGTIGAHLIRGGHDVLFVEANKAHIEAIKARGLTIKGQDTNLRVQAKVITPQDINQPLGATLLAVKALHTEQATRQIAPHLAPDGYVVSMQNGLNETVIKSIVGQRGTVGAFVNFGADFIEPGVIEYGGKGALYIGELDGAISPRIQQLQQTLRVFLPTVEVTDNIWGYLWGKQAYGAMLKATATVNDTIVSVLSNERARPMLANIAAEMLQVAEAEGISPEGFDGFEPDAFSFGPKRDVQRIHQSLDALIKFNQRSTKAKTGVWRDLAVRKRKTEVSINTLWTADVAANHNIELPLVSVVARIIGEIELNERKMSWGNIEELIGVNIQHYGEGLS